MLVCRKVELFAALKAGQRDPDLVAAQAFGGGDEADAQAEATADTAAAHLLMRLPGVGARNYRKVLAGCGSLADLATLSEAELAQLLGSATDAKKLSNFLNRPAPV